jgi:hypothetical protein
MSAGAGGADPLLELLADPPAERRPIPFWSWNDKLDPEVLAEQAKAMAERGMGGFFMHARGGLETEYLGEDWMRCIEAGIEAARRLGTGAWAYDEEGWPSGFAGGRVPALGERYQGRWLSLEPAGGELLRDYGDCAVYAHRNANYIDVLSSEAVRAFIRETHERYRSRLGARFAFLEGFFTDEPRLSGSIDRDMPWSPELPERFRGEYGYDLMEALPALFLPRPGHEALRYDFWRLVSRLFVSSFMEQIHEWCRSAGCELTGHLMMEESVYVQMANTGGVMPFYEHMDMPGIDWLRRGIGSPIVPKQVGSVAAQLGKKRVITESFALSGWDASLEELRWITHWQYVNGVNMLCQHLSAYSLRGFRKRDYPPSLFYQAPWWDEYGLFNDYVARLGLFLSEGRSAAKVLLLHPIRSGWVMYDGRDYDDAMRELDADFVRAADWLSGGHVEYHLGDETIIEAHGSIRCPGAGLGAGAAFVVGDCAYDAVVLPSLRCMGDATLSLLLEFAQSGGDIVSIGAFPALAAGRPDERLGELRRVSRNADPGLVGAREALPVIASASPSVRAVASGADGELGAIHLAVRDCGSRKLVFLANLDREQGYHARVKLPWSGALSRCDLERRELSGRGALRSADGSCAIELDFPPMGAHCLVLDEAGPASTGAALPAEDQPPSELVIRPEPGWEWELAEADPNALTLDSCEYRIDGGAWRSEKPVIAIQSELLELRRPCDISLRFRFESGLAEGFGPFFLVVERASDFRIELNGAEVPAADLGPWKDSSFRKIDISSFAKKGSNVLLLSRRFHQSPRVYEVLFGEGVYETEKNKLTYDVELESVYLVGDFSVRSLSPFTPGKRSSIHSAGPFVLGPRVDRIAGGDLTSRGFAFFSGRLTLARDLGPLDPGPRGRRLVLDLGRPRAALVEVRLNGQRAAMLPWAPFRADLTELARPDANRLEIRLYSSNRNLLGPHHHVEGESYKVGPESFAGRWSWAEKETEAFPAAAEDRTRSYWKDGCSFVTFGLL